MMNDDLIESGREQLALDLLARIQQRISQDCIHVYLQVQG